MRLMALLMAWVLAADAVAAGGRPASVRGMVVWGDSRTPVHGAQLRLRATVTRQTLTLPTGPGGAFRVDSVSPGSYDVVVETDRGRYAAASPVSLPPARTSFLEVSLPATEPALADNPTDATEAKSKRPKGWSNPATATATVLAFATALGIIVDETTEEDEEPAASPSEL